MKHPVSRQRQILKVRQGIVYETDAEIAVEFVLTLMVNGAEFATVVCSPVDLTDLVIGLLASEGVIRTADQLKSIALHEQKGLAYVELAEHNGVSIEQMTKRYIGSCCGKSRLFYYANDMRTAKTVLHRTNWSLETCFHLMRQLQADSNHFAATGGVHNAAIGTAEGGLICSRLDVGRHNALDKLYGWMLQSSVSARDKCIVFSGRISSEVLLKTAKMGVGLILSKSAPTDLALGLAEDLGITTVGFLRGDQCNIYTHDERITGLKKSDT